ncbi:hypothetical protein SAMN05444483_101274 [Salegentibacter echinorum]|uniref:DUF1684 domain-containing protein n=1 Tax=Salegentibacter echinorum TaxID=1073325 RepID=A0A1M5C0A3_SALEC|nr:hypothetical protein SAMN05444483_101274 [Salegentibacter echinorum]
MLNILKPNYSQWRFAVFIMLFLGNLGLAQEVDAVAFQKEMNEKFMNPEETPLSSQDLKNFKTLDFFQVNEDYKIMANFVRTPAEAPFLMQTTTERTPVYVKYGELYFTLKGRDFKLNVYQNRELLLDSEYYNHLFLPFTDLTNGESTYAGGRYLDLKIPTKSAISLDFNKAYNPYCAYNGKYSCPIPPAENDMNIAIKAGVKNYK